MTRRACCALALLLAASGAWLEAAPAGPEPPCPALEVTADGAPLHLGGTTIATVPQGTRLSALVEKDGRFQVQMLAGTNIRTGWLDAADVRRLDDADVDLAAEAFAILKTLDPELDTAKYQATLAALSSRVAAAAKDAAGAKALRRISRQLFRSERFIRRKDVRTLHAVLDRRGGNCLGLSLLYVCSARELDLPLRIVTVPLHCFVRYDDGKAAVNIETTLGGVAVPDAYIRRKHGSAGTELSHLEVVGVLHAEAGVVLQARDDHEGACRHFAHACRLAPRHGETYHNWGNSLLALNKLALACDKFARALQLNPRNAPALYTWGVALSRMGEHDWACEKFARAIEVDPRSAGAYYNWGLTLLRMGRHAEAFEKLNRAAALDPAFRAKVKKARDALR